MFCVCPLSIDYQYDIDRSSFDALRVENALRCFERNSVIIETNNSKMTSKVAAAENIEDAAVFATVSTHDAESGSTDPPSYDTMKPLQIHDQCHVQWRGTNRTTIIGEGSNASYINLPAVIVERRLARKKKRIAVPLDPKRNQSNKRLRTLSGCQNDPNNISEVVKKEMYDTLPADALEYYIHYIDHDRYVFGVCLRMYKMKAFLTYILRLYLISIFLLFSI
jgi:hypothetical protein